MKSKKVISGLIAAAVMSTMLFTGCGSNKQSGKKDSVSIIVWTNLETETNTLKKYGDMWAKKTGNTVKVIHQTPDLQKFAQAAKSVDGPDGIFGIANDQLASYVTAGMVQETPKSEYTDNDYVDASVKACYVNGKRYGVPIAVETNALFYNTDKVKEAPKTWDDLLKLAKAKGGIKFDATSIYYDLGFLRAYGSYIFKYNNGSYDVKNIGLGDENAVKAYTIIKSLATDYKFINSGTTSDMAKSSFQNGKTAFYIGGPWDVSGFKSAKTHFAVTTMPTLNGQNFVTPVGTQIGFVSSKSKKQAAVWSFYKYLMKNSPEELYKVGGRIPASLSSQKAIKADDITNAFIKQIACGEALPTVSELGQVWTPYSDNMKLMFQNKETPEKAAKNILKQVKEGIELMNSGK